MLLDGFNLRAFGRWGSPRLSATAMDDAITTRTARIWLGDDGLVHLQPIARREQTLDDARENVAAVAKVCGPKPMPLLIHFEAAAPQTPECREHYLSDEALSTVTAVAIVTNSMLGRIVGNLMIGTHTKGAPVQLFDSLKKASAWLLESRKRAAS